MINVELKAWLEDLHAGKPVETAIMGGLGVEYETAIQELAISIIQNLAEQEVPEDNEQYKKVVFAARDKHFESSSANKNFSGAQVHAATSIAGKFFSETPAKALQELKEYDADRIMTMQLLDGQLMLLNYKD
jgi:hypothetical protein